MTIYYFNLIGNENDLSKEIFLNDYDTNYIPLNNIPFSYYPILENNNYNNLINYSITKYKNCNIKTYKTSQNILLKFGGSYKINDDDEKSLEPSNYNLNFNQGTITITDNKSNKIIETNKSYSLNNIIPAFYFRFDNDIDINSFKITNANISLNQDNYIKGKSCASFNNKLGLELLKNFTSNRFSVSFWFFISNEDDNSNNQILASFINNSDKTGWKIYRIINENKILIWIGDKSKDTNSDIITINNINKNKWYHLVLVVEENLTNIYINGELRNKDGYKLLFINNNTSNPFIIANGLPNKSLIDDFRYYDDIILKSSEIKELYSGKIEISIKGSYTDCEINKSYTTLENNYIITLKNLKKELDINLKQLNFYDKVYNRYNIYPLAIINLIIWILLLSFSLKIINYYYSNYYLSFIIIIIIIILIITSLWFLYVNNIII